MDQQQQKKLQEKYIELQMVDQQIKQIQQQLQTFDSRMQELTNTKNALDDLKKTKVGSKILAPLSPYIYVQGELKNNQELQVNVGGDVNVTKSLEDTKKLVQEQLDEIQKYRDQVFLKLNSLSSRAQEIEKELSQYQQ